MLGESAEATTSGIYVVDLLTGVTRGNARSFSQDFCRGLLS
jgi:hypothetical protein